MTTDHFPDDYARDLAADLAIQQAATKGPWHAWSMPAKASGDPAHGCVIGCTYVSLDRGEALSPEDARAIANAGTHAQGWLRRAQAAEAAILALDAAITDPTKWGVSDAATAIQELAARIRAGREKGAQGA